MEKWEKEQFDLEYSQTLQFLEERRRHDPAFSPKELQELIEVEYINQGNDWTGGGLLRDARQAAVIAAYEAFLARWVKETAPDHS